MASSFGFEWPSQSLMDEMRTMVAKMASKSEDDVKLVVSPYRICPLGAHIDHQGGSVTAMALDKGVLLGFVSSDGDEMLVRSQQFPGEVHFRINSDLQKGCSHWGDYAKGAVLALKGRGHTIHQGILALLDGLNGLHGAGISSSAAVGISLLLALEHVNGLKLSEAENVELDRFIENEFLGLRNGVLDQSAILLSRRDCLTIIHCKDQTHELISPQVVKNKRGDFKVLLAFSGLRHALTSSTNYNQRVSECQAAANILLRIIGKPSSNGLLSDVTLEEYERHKENLEGSLAKRAKHFFTECARVTAGIKAWESSCLEVFGRLMTESGKSSIENYECGCKPMIQLLSIVLNAPGVFGARFSGAGFRGCCVALVSSESAAAAAKHVQEKYRQVQPDLAMQLEDGFSVLICDSADHARVL